MPLKYIYVYHEGERYDVYVTKKGHYIMYDAFRKAGKDFDVWRTSNEVCKDVDRFVTSEDIFVMWNGIWVITIMVFVEHALLYILNVREFSDKNTVTSFKLIGNVYFRYDGKKLRHPMSNCAGKSFFISNIFTEPIDQSFRDVNMDTYDDILNRVYAIVENFKFSRDEVEIGKIENDIILEINNPFDILKCNSFATRLDIECDEHIYGTLNHIHTHILTYKKDTGKCDVEHSKSNDIYQENSTSLLEQKSNDILMKDCTCCWRIHYYEGFESIFQETILQYIAWYDEWCIMQKKQMLCELVDETYTNLIDEYLSDVEVIKKMYGPFLMIEEYYKSYESLKSEEQMYRDMITHYYIHKILA